MLITPASAVGFLLSCCVLQRAVLCYKPGNKKLKITDWKCSSSVSKFLTLFEASLGNCTLGCDIRKKCNAVNYFRHLRMCELLSSGTFEEQQENVGSCVYINRNDIITNVLSDICKNDCSDHEACDREQEKCTVKECQPLSVEKAEILGNMVSFGSRCQIRCQSGYEALGGETGTTCSPTGEWEPPLLCKRQCPPAVAPSNGQVSAPKSYEGETATYTCNAGYSLIGSKTAMCQSESSEFEWNSSAPLCKKECPPAVGPSDGMVSAPNSYEGETATYTCNTGYSLIGSKTAMCQSGSWNSSAPLCKKACLPAVAPSEGQVSAPNSYEGETATYTCGTGYYLIGSKTAMCQSGSWNSSAPLCEADECASHPCLNGGVCEDGVNAYTCTFDFEFEGVNYGTNCTYAIGGQVLVCTNPNILTLRIYKNKLSQTNAAGDCDSIDWKLVKIDTKRKQEFIQNLLNATKEFLGKDYWIDGSNDSDNKTWRFADGATVPMTHDFWAYYAPNSPFVDHCVRMKAGGHVWDDTACSATHGYICELL